MPVNDAAIREADGDPGAQGEADDRPAEVGIVATGEHVEHQVGGADEGVGRGEEEPVAAERAWHTERGDEEGGHRREDHEADGTLLGVDDARQPGVPAPRPPEDRQREKALAEASPGRLAGHQGGALGQGEDEDEVEEQLERRDSSVVTHHRLEASVAGGGGHGDRLSVPE